MTFLRKTLRQLSLAATVCMVALLSTSCVSQLMLNYALKRNPSKDATRYEGECKRNSKYFSNLRDTVIQSAQDGVSLHAIYIAAPTRTLRTVVLLHGYGGNSASMLHMARFYQQELGMNVLLPDFYAHGQSRGRMRRMGWLDRLDMVQWIQVANEIFSFDGQQTQMLVTGVSMGGATTMMVSGEVESRGLSCVRCLVEDCGYTTVWDQFSSVLKGKHSTLLRMANRRCRRKYGWDFREASSLTQLSQCHLPMLFIHGGADAYVPTSMVHQVYEVYPGEKSLWIPDGITHAQSFDKANAEYRRRVSEFVGKYMP